MRRVIIENAWLPRHLRAQKIDLVHHLGGIVPPGCRVPAVVTLHDLQYLSYPAYFSAAKRRYLGLTQGRSLKRAEVVTAISEFTRSQAIEAFDLDASKVVVVPPVVRPMPTVSHERRAQVLSELGWIGPTSCIPQPPIPTRITLCCSRRSRRWRTRTTSPGITAGRCRRVGIGTLDACRCRRSGGEAWHRRTSPHARLRDVEQLAALYAGASMLAFPSRFEGFGIPMLGAMAAGCPVVAADATALPSLVGDAGMLVDPDDGPGWARTMCELLADDTARKRLSDAGRVRAAELAAIDPVQLLVDVYARVGP